MNKWDKRFLKLAQHISFWSLDKSTRVGSVIVDEDKRIVSVGYNGFPKNVEDSEERLDNRELKYQLVVHAEINSILFANRPLKDCVIYTWPMQPCACCSGAIIQSGIKKCVSVVNHNERWQESFKLSRQILKEAEVELVLYERL